MGIRIGNYEVNGRATVGSKVISVEIFTNEPYDTLARLYGRQTEITIYNEYSSETHNIYGIIGHDENEGKGTVTIRFRTATISPSAEEELRGGVEDADAALVELAAILMEQADIIADLDERVTALEDAQGDDPEEVSDNG